MSRPFAKELIAAALGAGLGAMPLAAQDAPDPDALLVVMDFTATTSAQGQDPTDIALSLAETPQLARIGMRVVPDGTRFDGALVFAGPDGFTSWREADMAAFFEPLGGMEAVDTDVSALRPALVAEALLDSARGGLGDVSITYENTGNEATGDADIDAVTVICPGENATCTPSN